MKQIIQEEWKIPLPEAYKNGLGGNNDVWK